MQGPADWEMANRQMQQERAGNLINLLLRMKQMGYEKETGERDWQNKLGQQGIANKMAQDQFSVASAREERLSDPLREQKAFAAAVGIPFPEYLKSQIPEKKLTPQEDADLRVKTAERTADVQGQARAKYRTPEKPDKPDSSNSPRARQSAYIKSMRDQLESAKKNAGGEASRHDELLAKFAGAEKTATKAGYNPASQKAARAELERITQKERAVRSAEGVLSKRDLTEQEWDNFLKTMGVDLVAEYKKQYPELAEMPDYSILSAIKQTFLNKK